MSEQKPEWLKMKPAEMEKIVMELHKEGLSPAKIGLVLRDKHGMPKAKLLGKKIAFMLKDSKVNYEKENVEDKIRKLEKHIAKNKHDYTSKRSLTKKLWILKKLG